MRRAISSIISLLLIVLVISFIVSLLTADRFSYLDIELQQAEGSAFFSSRNTAVSINSLTENNYQWLHSRIYHHDADRGFQHIDLRPLHDNNLYAVEVSLPHAGFFKNNMQLNEKRLQEIADYYAAVKMPRKEDGPGQTVKISSIRGISRHLNSELKTDYAGEAEAVEESLHLQFKAVEAITAVTNPAPLVIEPGIIPEESRQRYSEYYMRRGALSDAARNIFQAWRSYINEKEKNDETVNISIALLNSAPGDYRLGVSLSELSDLREQIIRLNRAYGSPVENIEEKLSIAVDTSNLFEAWQSGAAEEYINDRTDEPVSEKRLAELLKEELTRKVYNSDKPEVYLSIAYISYYGGNLAEKAQSGRNLPYTRAENARDLMQQLRLLKALTGDAVRFRDDFQLVAHMPVREMFPLVHRIVKPLARAWNFYFKRDGSDHDELEASLQIVHRYLNTQFR